MMLQSKIKFIWTPLFFIMFIYEYFAPGMVLCGSMALTGQMWFMWFIMSLSACGAYVELLERALENRK